MPPTAAPDHGAVLDKLADDLQAEYGHRHAHQGRLEQIAAILASARGLIAELPDEAAREDAHEAELLAYQRSPEYDPKSLNHDARAKLAELLAPADGNGAAA